LLNEGRENAFILERLVKAFFNGHRMLFKHKQVVGAGIASSFNTCGTRRWSRFFMSTRILAAAVATSFFFAVRAISGPGPFDLLGSVLSHTKGERTLPDSANQHLKNDQDAANPRFHDRFTYPQDYNFMSAGYKTSLFLAKAHETSSQRIFGHYLGLS
jgi:hypothetical protein